MSKGDLKDRESRTYALSFRREGPDALRLIIDSSVDILLDDAAARELMNLIEREIGSARTRTFKQGVR